MREQILPFYVVCDESYSMCDHIDALNDGLVELHRAIGTDPVVADKTRFCLIGFSTTAEVLLPLSDLSDITEMAGLAAKSQTNYIGAFNLLRDTIDEDITKLKADGHLVYRPAVFFLSDGQPTDSEPWRSAYERLVDERWAYRPNIIAFGIGSAIADIVSEIGTFKAFMSEDGVSPGTALHEFARALTKSIVKSGSTIATTGEVTLQVPEKIPGFTELKVDPL